MKNILYLALLSICLLSCESKEQRMYRIAQKAIIARFKDPSGLKFHPNADSVAYNNDNHSFMVLGTVEAKNLLGMPLAEKWVVIIKSKTDNPSFNKDDDWEVAGAEFESEIEKREREEVELEEKQAIHILKTDSKYNRLMDGYTIYATVQNASDKLLEYGSLQATFYDKDNNVIGVGSGFINNLPANETRVVEILATDIQAASRYNVEINNVTFH